MAQDSVTAEQLLQHVGVALGIIKNGVNEKEITTSVEKSKDTQTIIVPAGMSYLDASKELKAQHDNEEQVIDAVHEFEGWEWRDVLVAIKKVSEAKFGWIRGITERSPFGDIRPKEIDVTVDVVNDVLVIEKCFYGKFGITAWDKAEASVGVGAKGCFINIKLKKKYSNDATSYFLAIDQHLQTNSIFKGKTVVVEGNKSAFAINYGYEIIENKGGDHIILNHDTALVIKHHIIDDLGEPGKKSYLFTGPFGNGKTETAMEIGRRANNLGMTFFYVKDAGLFDIVLNQSKKYQPCIIFMEDIDEIGSGEERDADMNKILNTLDGVQTKGNDLTVIFTTNNENKLAPALRRPGRISTIVRFMNPTQETGVKIMKQYFRGIPGAEKIDYEGMVGKLGDISASVIAEACKKSFKLASRKGSIDNDIVESSIISMEYHILLMKTPVEVDPVEKRFVGLLREVLNVKD